jgi:hypothetical protein
MALLAATTLTAAIRPDLPGGDGDRINPPNSSSRRRSRPPSRPPKRQRCRDRHAAGQRASRLIVFNSVHNAIVEPFAAPAPRPGYSAARDALPPVLILAAHERHAI